MTQIRTELVMWQTHRDQLSKIRLTVFVEEQDVPIDEEWDEWDESSWHWLAYDANDNAVGTARLTSEGQIGRMAVIKEYRGKGVGTQLLTSALTESRAHFQTVFLHAQTQVIEFYQRAGFELAGPVFNEAGIAHQKMTLKY